MYEKRIHKKQKRKREAVMAIFAISLAIIMIVAFLFASGTVELDIGIPLNPSAEKTTTSRVIVQGKISVFEDIGCTKPTQTINWGEVETNHQYSYTAYVRNDNQEKGIDSGKRDIVWQRENVNPDSIYISIKCYYADKKIEPNEIRQVTITLTVLGILEDSYSLNSSVEVPQFTFDLKLTGQDLSLLRYVYIRCYANRDANNITVVYKDELKETISVAIEIKRLSDMELIWNTTRYASEIFETWLDADIYTNYQLIVTMNHERYGIFDYRNLLYGQLP